MIQLKSPIERLKMGCSMYETSRFLLVRAILENDPNISKNELRKEFFRRFYANDFTPVMLEKILNHLERYYQQFPSCKAILEDQDLAKASGIWAERKDLPDFNDLRAEFNRLEDDE